VLGRQYKHEALVYNVSYHQDKSVSCGEQVIVSVGGTATSCEGKQNPGSDGKGGAGWKYWEVLERQKKGNIIASIPSLFHV
jgi:hypothetical protein